MRCLCGLGLLGVKDERDDESSRVRAWDHWLDECVPGVHLGDDFGCDELAEQLALAVELVVPGQPMVYSARQRWWRAWLRVEADHSLDLEVATDRAGLASHLARVVPGAPFKDALGRWHVFGDRGQRSSRGA
jgi:hypothetical protein